LLDVPAENPTLNFEQIASALATVVQTSQPRFAVGIFGGWGCGKSTLMDDIARRLRADGQALVVEFNAWRYEREPHLIVPLLDTIRGALSAWADAHEATGRQDQTRDIARRIGRVVRALVQATSVDIGVPGAVTLKVDPGVALEQMTSGEKDDAKTPQSLYFAAFQELSAAFSLIGGFGPSRVVVFVDDLDRCLPDQALTVLESMKLFFDMPGFVFIVGLDERAVQAAVRKRFASNGDEEQRGQVEREYLKKMFQVPYTLQPIAPGQVDTLLNWMDEHCELGHIQRVDLRTRVRRYLEYVAPEGRVNPREVKRYINAYTLHRMIRPDLDPDTVLALQTIDFRVDWEEVYEDIVLAEPDVFVDALRSFRDENNNQAFEDFWPELGVLPLELSAFLRSDAAAALAIPDLERYVSSLEAVRSTSTHPWVVDAMRDVGHLRRLTRQVAPPLRFGSATAITLSQQAKDVLGRFTGSTRGDMGTQLNPPVEKLLQLVQTLAPSHATEAQPRETPPQELETWRTEADAAIDMLQHGLRLIRRGSAFAAF
jgi:hypothetical protein